MNVFGNSDTRFRGLPLKVGIFVLAGALASLALLLTLAERQGYFQAKSALRVEATTGADLRPGMAVKLSGFKIGEVRSVALNERARVDVIMRIEDRYLRWIKQDSLVSVSREGLIGDSYLSVSSGSENLPPLKEGDSVQFEAVAGFADIAKEMRDRVLPAVDGTTELLAYLNKPDGDFRATVAGMNALAKELQETSKRLDRLLANTDRTLNQDLRQTLANSDRTLATVDREMTSMSKRSDETMTRIDEASATAAETAKAATAAIEGTAPRVDRLLENSNAAITEARAMIDGARKRWLFRGGKPPAATPAIPPLIAAPPEAGADGNGGDAGDDERP